MEWWAKDHQVLAQIDRAINRQNYWNNISGSRRGGGVANTNNLIGFCAYELMNRVVLSARARVQRPLNPVDLIKWKKNEWARLWASFLILITVGFNQCSGRGGLFAFDCQTQKVNLTYSRCILCLHAIGRWDWCGCLAIDCRCTIHRWIGAWFRVPIQLVVHASEYHHVQYEQWTANGNRNRQCGRIISTLRLLGLVSQQTIQWFVCTSGTTIRSSVRGALQARINGIVESLIGE